MKLPKNITRFLVIFSLPILFGAFILYMYHSYLSYTKFNFNQIRNKQINLLKTDYDTLNIIAYHKNEYYFDKELHFQIVINLEIAKYIINSKGFKLVDRYVEDEDQNFINQIARNIDSNLVIYWELWEDDKLIKSSYTNIDYDNDKRIYNHNIRFSDKELDTNKIKDKDITLDIYSTSMFPINSNYNYKLRYKVKHNSHLFDTKNIFIGYLYDEREETGILSGTTGNAMVTGGVVFVGVPIFIVISIIAFVIFFLLLRRDKRISSKSEIV
jgi:hypothetical protein